MQGGKYSYDSFLTGEEIGKEAAQGHSLKVLDF